MKKSIIVAVAITMMVLVGVVGIILCNNVKSEPVVEENTKSVFDVEIIETEEGIQCEFSNGCIIIVADYSDQKFENAPVAKKGGLVLYPGFRDGHIVWMSNEFWTELAFNTRTTNWFGNN